MNYLNTEMGKILFEESRRSDIYVDKSMLIQKISACIKKQSKYLCITRPRRFGKTMNASMLSAYYTKGLDSRQLFHGLAIEKEGTFEKHLNRYQVIHIDFSRIPVLCRDYEAYITAVLKLLAEDIWEGYPQTKEISWDNPGRLLRTAGEQFVFILDEWDSVFYRSFTRREDKEHFLLFLKELLKDQPYVALAYMTGILPICKYSSGSELNMFDEYNFMNDNVFDGEFGFTEEEVCKLCEEYPEVTFDEIKKWYNGYCRTDGSPLFNPRSVSKALQRGVCQSYWTETGPMDEIADCVEHNVEDVREDIVKMVAGFSVEAELQGYSAEKQQMETREEILSAMVVYGFLSYYDGELRIPNHELMLKFQQVLKRKSMGAIKEITEKSKEMLRATLEENEARVAEILEEIHDREIPFLQYNDENSLSCVITLCYLYAREKYEVMREEKCGKGYADYLFLPKKKTLPAIILELKVHKSAEDALEQIKEREYIRRIPEGVDALLVGIGYDEKKRHGCKIERVDKKQQHRRIV